MSTTDAPGDQPGSPDVLSAAIDQRDRLLDAIQATVMCERDRAEELLQEVTLRSLKLGVHLETAADWFRYLRQAARNLAANEWKMAERAREREDLVSERTRLGSEAVSDPAVDTIAMRMQWLDGLDDLQQLPASERKVFVLRHYDDYKIAEIADMTGLKPRQVEVKLRQASQRLAKMRESRQQTSAYALLAILMRRSDERVVTAGTAAPVVLPGVSGVAAAVAFAMIAAVTSSPAAPMNPAGPISRVEAAPSPLGAPGAPAGDSQQPRAALAVGAGASGSPRRGILHPGMHVTAHVPVPVGMPCLTADCRRRDGSRVKITVLGQEQWVNDSVVHCAAVPDNPIVSCAEQETAP